ncbi:MAG: dihydrodipicolinate synthase family protein [Candidatus Hydrogenedentes bacterium]|nr:dihydrodipicolinate synthase family protein [Candidatus Hydrogenedentota bacterium]
MSTYVAHGVIANVFTAFNEDLSLDDDGQRHFLDFVLANNANSAFFVRSGMGQMYTYNYDEVKQITRTACKHLAGKAPVVVGSTGIWDQNFDALPDPAVFTRQAVELSKYAQDQGAAAVVHTLPEAIRPRAGETEADVILRYFETISDAVSVPIMIYQPPAMSKPYCVTVDLIRKLADMPKVHAIKVSTGDAGYILDLTWAVRGKDFVFISGNECAFFAGLCSGAKAVIGQGACVNPQILKAVQDRFDAGDIDGAMDAQRSTNLLVYEAVNPVEFLKRYATENGHPVKPYRRPTFSASYGEYQQPNLSDADYTRYKAVLERELAKYR